MKVLFVIESLGNGGAERVLVSTVGSLAKLGVTAEVAMLFDDSSLQPELENLGIKVHALKIRNKWNLPGGMMKLKKMVSAGNYDLIHAHLFFAHFYTGILKKFFLPGIITVVTLHNLGYDADPAVNLLKKIRKYADGKIIQSFNIKIAVSNAVKNSFRSHLNIQDIQVINNGFPVAEVQAAVQGSVRPAYYAVNKCNIITPGRLVKEKGHKYLLEAVSRLNNKYDNLNFYFAGEGPLRQEIEDTIKVLGLQNVVLLGNLMQKELFISIQHADFVVIPSVSEGFPTIVGECMALGKAIVATNAGGIPDFIDDGVDGMLLGIEDGKKLGEKIEVLLTDHTKLQELENKALCKVQKFDINKVSKEYLAIYKNVMN